MPARSRARRALGRRSGQPARPRPKTVIPRPQFEFGFRRRAALRLRPSHVRPPRREKGARVAFHCCRCGTSSSSRTWWCRCSSGARNRSARSRRRWGRARARRQGDLPLRAAQGRRPTSRSPRTSSRSGRSATIIQLLRLPDGTVKVLVEGKRRARHPPLHADRRLLHRRDRGDPRRRTSARWSWTRWCARCTRRSRPTSS